MLICLTYALYRGSIAYTLRRGRRCYIRSEDGDDDGDGDGEEGERGKGCFGKEI